MKNSIKKGYLIDTHVAIWWLLEPNKLSARALAILESPNATIYFSSISGYELMFKHLLGKLRLNKGIRLDIASEVAKEGWKVLEVTLEDTAHAANLDLVHRDPFDRILAAQALVKDIPIISTDRQLDSFSVSRIWK